MDTIFRYRHDNFSIRPAVVEDVPVIRAFVRSLADYVNMLDRCVVQEADLREGLFEKKAAEVVIGEADGDAVAFALFFPMYSSLTGKSGLHLEDLFVKEKARGNGYGKVIMRYLAKQAVDRGCSKLHWNCRKWNSPSITFYHSLGAEDQDDSLMFRLSGEALHALAAEAEEA